METNIAVEALVNCNQETLEINQLFQIIEILIQDSEKITKEYLKRISYIQDNLRCLFKNKKIIKLNKNINQELNWDNDVLEKVKGIIGLFDAGCHPKAYEEINSLVDSTEIFKDLLVRVSKERCFYRCREQSRNSKFEILDLFHVPFNLRHLVSNARYSLSGFPSLYLGSSILTCWEELGRPNLSSLCAIAVKPKTKWILIDMRLYKKMNTKRQLEKYLKHLPILIACGIPKAHKDGGFHSEYLIPQALTSLLVSTKPNYIDGFTYCSTRIRNDHSLFYNSGYSYLKNLHCYNIM